MPILLKRKNGEITPFRNAEYISAFYFIPKSILDKCGEEINSIPPLWYGLLWGLAQKGKFIQDMSRLGDMRTQLLFGLKEWKMKGLSLSHRRY